MNNERTHLLPALTDGVSDANKTMSSTINQQDARHVLFHFEPRTVGAMAPGSFTTKLLLAYSSADFTNRARMALGFPSLAAAFNLVSDTYGGLEELSKIATGKAALDE